MPVDLNVRGICCLRPGVPGVSENIRVVSVVGRFLEHSRLYTFHRGDEIRVLIGSADLMPRNLDHRVELVTPVEDPTLQAELVDVLERCLADNSNAWELDSDGVWTRISAREQGRRSVQEELRERHGGTGRRAARDGGGLSPRRPLGLRRWRGSRSCLGTARSSISSSRPGRNTLRAARLLDQMMATWPDDGDLGREILKAEQEGDRITHDIVKRLNSTFVTPIDREDIYGLATQMDDIVDYTEEAADLLGLYQIEAPMAQAQALTEVLVSACEQLANGLEHLREFKGLDKYWIEIHRLENEGDRISRNAVASLFSNGIDPMVVIRWKDMFAVLENAIDATETAAQIIEGIVIKNS